MEKRTKYTPNDISINKNYAEISLYDKNCKEITQTKIDIMDIRCCKLEDYKWHLGYNGYAVTNTYEGDKRIILKLHQLIIGKKKGLVIDHINHDRLDNRKQNLRHCTIAENCRNQKKKDVGVTWHKVAKKWHAEIIYNKKRYYLGLFKDKKEALKKRLQAEKKYYGEFAPCQSE